MTADPERAPTVTPREPGTGASAREALFRLPKFGSGVGFHRLRWLCREALDTEWGRGLEAIRVTGSAGKGSVCAMVAAILAELGVEAGLYTSPHLFRLNERIALDGEAITDGELEAAAEWLLERRGRWSSLHPGDEIGSFEALTAMAIRHFAGRRPATVVAEAGIGGRLDATRIVPGRVVGLVSLDLEHTGLLGGSLELVGYDKADLCPDGGVLVVGSLPEACRERLAAYCAVRDVRLVQAMEACRVDDVRLDEDGTSFTLVTEELTLADVRLSLRGRHQAANAAIATALVHEWLGLGTAPPGPAKLAEAVRSGLGRAAPPGRFERVARAPDTFIDVGHSPRAAAETAGTARELLGEAGVVLVLGVSHDKDAEGIVRELAPVARRVVCTRACHKGSPPDRVAGLVERTRPDLSVEVEGGVDRAVERARALASAEGGSVLVAGGLFLAAEAAVALEGGDPRDLRFL